MVFVKAKKGESNDALIRRFTRDIVESGILPIIKDMRYFKPPSEIRKEKKNKRRKR